LSRDEVAELALEPTSRAGKRLESPRVRLAAQLLVRRRRSSRLAAVARTWYRSEQYSRRIAMRINWLVLATASLLLAVGVSAADNKDTLRGDKGKLQGKWQIVSVAIEDRVIKRDDVPREWKGTFEKDLFVEGERFGQVGYSSAKIEVDETRDPKQITVRGDGGKLTFRGIYFLEGDNLKVCMNGDGSDVRRPEEFVTKKGTPLLLIVLKKAPADKK
jgi:uncharacterized protein (TIGR03067 family)